MSNSILIEGRNIPGYYDINNKYIAAKYIPSKRIEIPVTDVNSAYARKPVIPSVIPTVEPVIPTVEPIIPQTGNWLQRNPKKIIVGAIGLNILRPGDKPEQPINKIVNKPETNTNTQSPDHNNWVGSITNNPNLLLGGTIATGLGYLALKKMRDRRQYV